MHVQNKVAIITGASSGFGKALACRLVSKGAKVILADIDVKDGERLETELNYDKQEKIAHFVQCDVTDYAQQANLFRAAEVEFGGVDIIVNNAGIAERVPLGEDHEGVWRKVLEIDLLAVIEGVRLGVLYLTKQGRGGVIINTASLAGLYPQPRTPAYTAAKFGVVGLTRSFKDYFPADDEAGNTKTDSSNTTNTVAKKNKIRVNAVAPSFADTKIIDGSREYIYSLNGMVTVDQVVDAFMLLIEDDSYNGDIARVTPRYGVNVIGRTQKSIKEGKGSKL
ncbi:hypothetical protein BG004_004558 [Podila humilis]|nr:hypothetical protein BG004_004558 [Podila humilis]